jgi:hypothetical protein
MTDMEAKPGRKRDSRTPAPHDLVHLINQATNMMAAQYTRIRQLAADDPGTAGDQGEENWARVLRDWLPASLHVVTKGRIIAVDGRTSPQVDVLVLSSAYPRGLLDSKLYFAAGVLAAFECKNTMRREHIVKAMQTSATIGDLGRRGSLEPCRIPYGILAHSHAMSSAKKTTEDIVFDTLVDADLRYIDNFRDCLSFVCISDLGTWTHSREIEEGGGEDGRDLLSTSYDGPSSTLAEEYGKVRPDAIGRFLTTLISAIGKMDKSISPIAEYFECVGLPGVSLARVRDWPGEKVTKEVWREVYGEE